MGEHKQKLILKTSEPTYLMVSVISLRDDMPTLGTNTMSKQI